MKLSERMSGFVGAPDGFYSASLHDWVTQVAALEEQLLERQAECFVLGDELASVRQWAKAWKQAAKFWHGWKREEDEFWLGVVDARDAYKALADFRKRERNSARRVARALYAVYRVEADFRFGKIAYWDRWGAMAPSLADARRVLAQEARNG